MRTASFTSGGVAGDEAVVPDAARVDNRGCVCLHLRSGIIFISLSFFFFFVFPFSPSQQAIRGSLNVRCAGKSMFLAGTER